MAPSFKSVLFLGIFALSLLPSLARSDSIVAERMPASMGALGDSMTAGALAMFRRQDFVLPWVDLMVVLRALTYGATNEIRTVESRKLSWAAGYDSQRRVESHSYRLTQLQNLKKQIPSYNAAISGSGSRKVLDQQLDTLSDWSRKTLGKAYPDYVTLMIGPNDICAESAAEMLDTNSYHSNLSRIVDDILVRGSDSKIVVSAVPNVEALRSVAKNSRVYWGVSCEKVWQAVNICPTLTMEDDPVQRAIVASRVSDYNNALREIIRTRRADFGDRIRLAEQSYDIAFSPDDLSVDCFHPNADGQALLAETTWDVSWWASEWPARRAEIEAEEKRKKELRCRHVVRGGRGARRPPGC
jgi:lysophospholipase L1-like esterase